MRKTNNVARTGNVFDFKDGTVIALQEGNPRELWAYLQTIPSLSIVVLESYKIEGADSLGEIVTLTFRKNGNGRAKVFKARSKEPELDSPLITALYEAASFYVQ